MSITEQLAATHLGKKSLGSELYDKSLLVAVPRFENRQQYNIEENNLPFVGYDIWDAYEVSFMTQNNIPCTYVLKIKYPANSPFIVESKSLKLYLNSFNMTPLKATINESKDFFIETVKRDLSDLLKTDVSLKLHDTFSPTECTMFQGYKNIRDIIDLDTTTCTRFNEAPDELQFSSDNDGKDLKITFDAVRSNCKITHQPDFADIFIHIKSDKGIDISSLVKYIVSFRKENHFHEECVEMIYKRLLDKYTPDILMVAALYTRRGGIDICPIRANDAKYLDTELLDITKYTKRTIKQ